MMKRNKESGILFKISTVIFVCLLLAVLSAVSGCDSTGHATADRTYRLVKRDAERANTRLTTLEAQRLERAKGVVARGGK